MLSISLLFFFHEVVKTIGKLKELALRFLCNDHESSYGDLIQESRKCTSSECSKSSNYGKFLQIHIVALFFQKSLCLIHMRSYRVTFALNCLRSVGPQIWNGLPNKLKSTENLKNSKFRQSNGIPQRANVQICKCSACRNFYFI